MALGGGQDTSQRRHPIKLNSVLGTDTHSAKKNALFCSIGAIQLFVEISRRGSQYEVRDRLHVIDTIIILDRTFAAAFLPTTKKETGDSNSSRF